MANSDGALAILGGRDRKDCFLDDLFLLKLDYHKWIQINVKGMVPRAMHGMTSIKNTIYVFGGYNEKGFVSALFYQYEILFDEKGDEREKIEFHREINKAVESKPTVRWSTLEFQGHNTSQHSDY